MVSDVVMVTAITVGGGIVTILVKYWLNRLDKKLDRRFDKQDEKLDKVEKNTDGLVKHLVESKDAEIKSAGELGEKKGEKTATAEAKIEIDQLNKDSKPNNKQ